MTNIIVNCLDDARRGFPLLDALPDSYAWLKDREGTFIAANQRFLQRFGFKEMADLIGKHDIDLSSSTMTEQYLRDDALVLTGEAVSDRLELINQRGEAASWFLTSKWPVYDAGEHIIGSFGCSRHLQATELSVSPFRELNAPVEYIRQHYMEAITVSQLADFCHLSISALERRFKKHLGKTPKQYIGEVRLDRARHLILESQLTLGEIALQTGFSDQSHFTRAYAKRFSINPSAERKRATTTNK